VLEHLEGAHRVEGGFLRERRDVAAEEISSGSTPT
jgi:hypothetical protein